MPSPPHSRLAALQLLLVGPALVAGLLFTGATSPAPALAADPGVQARSQRQPAPSHEVYGYLPYWQLDAGTARRIVIRTVRALDGRIELSVSDNGPGVAADMIDRLFIPYATSKPTGTGLGLVISQSIAQAHGGSIAYRVNEPSGACFFVRLAVAE